MHKGYAIPTQPLHFDEHTPISPLLLQIQPNVKLAKVCITAFGNIILRFGELGLNGSRLKTLGNTRGDDLGLGSVNDTTCSFEGIIVRTCLENSMIYGPSSIRWCKIDIVRRRRVVGIGVQLFLGKLEGVINSGFVGGSAAKFREGLDTSG
jgi:hypothetical protein